MKDKQAVLVLGLFVASLVVVAVIFTLLIFGQFSTTRIVSNNSNTATAAGPNESPQNGNVFSEILEGSPEHSQTPAVRVIEIIVRLFLAVVLAGVLAFRPRKNVPLFRRSLFVSQTQILLAMVAAALMLVVGDNTARAFAIFAAASLVRFRTNIRDPKEITVLLISLGLGLACGVGRWDLGVALCLFSLVLLWLLEFKEPEHKVRAMELTIKTRSPERSQDILKIIFQHLKIDAEVREIVPTDDDHPVGSLKYYLNLPLNLTTDRLSDDLLEADPENTEGIQWSKSKNVSDIYQ